MLGIEVTYKNPKTKKQEQTQGNGTEMKAQKETHTYTAHHDTEGKNMQRVRAVPSMNGVGDTRKPPAE